MHTEPLPHVSRGTPHADVTVVIPLFNKAEWIARALSSVMRQTAAVDAIFVVDDGSTDDGPAIVERVARDGSIIRLVRQANAGPGAARNAGLALVTTRYVAFLDADDEWRPQFMQTALDAFETCGEECGAVWGEALLVFGGQERLWRPLPAGVFRANDQASIPYASRVIAACHTGAGVIRSDVAKRLGGFFDKSRALYGEDHHFRLKLFYSGPVCLVSEQLMLYHRDASFLEANYSGELQPYLRWPALLLEECAPDGRENLTRLLRSLALDRARSFAYQGHMRSALRLILRFSSRQYGVSFLHLWLAVLSLVAPVLPFVRRARRRFVNIRTPRVSP